MITLITGAPGSGKTALTIDMLLNYGDRPIFADGIPDLAIDHQPCPPVPEWTHTVVDQASATGKKLSFTFPQNAVVVIDECQRVYRPRSASSKVPNEVAAFETHRHLGIDFILITQHPALIDSNIRRLIGRHIHIRVSALGRYRYEWPEVGNPETKTSRDLAARSRFKLPKRSFDRYKSAELHTKTKLRIPGYFWLFITALLMFGGALYYTYRTVYQKTIDGKPVEKLNHPLDSKSEKTNSTDHPKAKLTAAEYIEDRRTRVPGLLHTALVYDEVTKPVEAPYPQGCIQSKNSCRCYTQQGTIYETEQAICKQIVAKGFFIDWKIQETRKDEQNKKYSRSEKNDSQNQPVAQILSLSPPAAVIATHIKPLPGGSHLESGSISEAPKQDNKIAFPTPG